MSRHASSMSHAQKSGSGHRRVSKGVGNDDEDEASGLNYSGRDDHGQSIIPTPSRGNQRSIGMAMEPLRTGIIGQDSVIPSSSFSPSTSSSSSSSHVGRDLNDALSHLAHVDRDDILPTDTEASEAEGRPFLSIGGEPLGKQKIKPTMFNSFSSSSSSSCSSSSSSSSSSSRKLIPMDIESGNQLPASGPTSSSSSSSSSSPSSSPSTSILSKTFFIQALIVPLVSAFSSFRTSAYSSLLSASTAIYSLLTSLSLSVITIITTHLSPFFRSFTQRADRLCLSISRAFSSFFTRILNFVESLWHSIIMRLSDPYFIRNIVDFSLGFIFGLAFVHIFLLVILAQQREGSAFKLGVVTGLTLKIILGIRKPPQSPYSSHYDTSSSGPTSDLGKVATYTHASYIYTNGTVSLSPDTNPGAIASAIATATAAAKISQSLKSSSSSSSASPLSLPTDLLIGGSKNGTETATDANTTSTSGQPNLNTNRTDPITSPSSSSDALLPPITYNSLIKGQGPIPKFIETAAKKLSRRNKMKNNKNNNKNNNNKPIYLSVTNSDTISTYREDVELVKSLTPSQIVERLASYQGNNNINNNNINNNNRNGIDTNGKTNMDHNTKETTNPAGTNHSNNDGNSVDSLPKQVYLPLDPRIWNPYNKQMGQPLNIFYHGAKRSDLQARSNIGSDNKDKTSQKGVGGGNGIGNGNGNGNGGKPGSTSVDSMGIDRPSNNNNIPVSDKGNEVTKQESISGKEGEKGMKGHDRKVVKGENKGKEDAKLSEDGIKSITKDTTKKPKSINLSKLLEISSSASPPLSSLSALISIARSPSNVTPRRQQESVLPQIPPSSSSSPTPPPSSSSSSSSSSSPIVSPALATVSISQSMKNSNSPTLVQFPVPSIPQSNQHSLTDTSPT